MNDKDWNRYKKLHEKQLILKVNINPDNIATPPKLTCPSCKVEMIIVVAKFYRAHHYTPNNKGPPP